MSLPPISKAFGTICLVTTAAFHLGLFNPYYAALLYKLVFTRFEVWRLVANFFFLGKFSVKFGIRLLIIARYGVQLENGPFERRTTDFLWMIIFGCLSLLALAVIPFFWTPFLGVSLVFMLLYVWSQEFPNAQVNIYGLVSLKYLGCFYEEANDECFVIMESADKTLGSYIKENSSPKTRIPLPLPVVVEIMLQIARGMEYLHSGFPITPDLLGIIAGHLYYFLTVLHPLASGKHILRTPKWVYISSWRDYDCDSPAQLQLELQLGHNQNQILQPVGPLEEGVID